MSAPNDSVTICDSPSPSKPTAWDETVTNYRKRLRSSSNFKLLLDKVYESPLVHFRRNMSCRPNETNTDINGMTVLSTPPPKKRKINAASTNKKKSPARLDQSVVILNDSIIQPVIELVLSDTETNDVVEVPKASKSVVSPAREKKSKKKFSAGAKSSIKNRHKSQNEKTPKKKETKKKGKKGKRAKTSQTATKSSTNNDENHNGQIMETSTNATGETEDIEIVWVSGPKSKSTSQEHASVHQPFVVDTSRNLDNLIKIGPLRTKKAKRPADLKRLQGKKKQPRFKAYCKTMGAMMSNEFRNTPAVIFNGNVPPRDSGLREIVIDGCSVAMGHTNGRVFSEKGLEIVINYFRQRGHVVTAFLPQSMRMRDRELLELLHKQGFVVFTPSRTIGGRNITPYDDRFILDYATKCNGIVVSSDQYRDLWQEKPQWRDTIENRLLPPTFVGDYLMFPEDPLGRTGPKLEEFLRF